MNLKMYSLFDSAAQSFNNPIYMHNDGLAVRLFQDQVNSKEDNQIKLHPEQFTLFRVGEWNDKDCTFNILDTPRSIALGVELINDNEPRYSNTDLEELDRKVDEMIKLYKGQEVLAEIKVGGSE